jgi:hypothetical protein
MPAKASAMRVVLIMVFSSFVFQLLGNEVQGEVDVMSTAQSKVKNRRV